MNDDLKKVRAAADKLLEHVVFYNMEDRVGADLAEFFIDELVRISKGKVKYGAMRD